MKERITFEEWYKFNVVNNEIIDRDTDCCVKVFTSEAMSGIDMVMKTQTSAFITFKLFAKLSVISISPIYESCNSSMCVCLYLDLNCDNHKEETAHQPV